MEREMTGMDFIIFRIEVDDEAAQKVADALKGNDAITAVVHGDGLGVSLAVHAAKVGSEPPHLKG